MTRFENLNSGRTAGTENGITNLANWTLPVGPETTGLLPQPLSKAIIIFLESAGAIPQMPAMHYPPTSARASAANGVLK